MQITALAPVANTTMDHDVIKIKPLFVTILFVFFCLPTYATSDFRSVSVAGASVRQQPIMIQGPMPIEAEYFAGLLTDVRLEVSGKTKFYVGTLDGYPVVVAQTGKGLENTAAATAIGIEKYHPRLIINQGTSGGHDPSLNVGDIVLGERSANIGNFKTPKLPAGAGSQPLNWKPMDLLASQGSAGEGKSAADSEQIRFYLGDTNAMDIALSLAESYSHGKVVKGTIGSGNFWNNELDRIAWLHKNYGTSVEEMETASAAQIAFNYGVPFLGIRVLSNNITNGGHYNPQTAEYCQEYVKSFVKAYIKQRH